MIGIELVPPASAVAEPTAPACPAEPAPQVAPAAGRMIRDLHSGLDVRLTEAAGRTRAAISGEIDLGCSLLLERVLAEGLRSTPGGLDVDLRGVEFFDCSGLNVLLQLRARAEEAGAELAVTGMSPAVRRVFELTGCDSVFA